jgi:hypothetical protein
MPQLFCYISFRDTALELLEVRKAAILLPYVRIEAQLRKNSLLNSDLGLPVFKWDRQTDRRRRWGLGRLSQVRLGHDTRVIVPRELTSCRDKNRRPNFGIALVFPLCLAHYWLTASWRLPIRCALLQVWGESAVDKMAPYGAKARSWSVTVNHMPTNKTQSCLPHAHVRLWHRRTIHGRGAIFPQGTACLLHEIVTTVNRTDRASHIKKKRIIYTQHMKIFPWARKST